MTLLRSLQLKAEDFGSTAASCLGWHIAEVVRAVSAARPSLTWYVADIQTSGYQFPVGGQAIPSFIGGADTLVTMALRVDQFESGVFVGVPDNILYPQFREGGLWTEDDELADLGDALIEIRAFDTTFISVVSNDEALLVAIRKSILKRS